MRRRQAHLDPQTILKRPDINYKRALVLFLYGLSFRENARSGARVQNRLDLDLTGYHYGNFIFKCPCTKYWNSFHLV